LVSTGDGGGAGANKIAQDTANIIAQIPAIVEGLTGIDLVEMIKSLPAIKRADDGEEKETSEASPENKE
jgi:flotillin